MEEWEILVTDECLDWFGMLDRSSQALITDAIDRLAAAGPQLGRPLVDRIKGSELHNLNLDAPTRIRR